MKTKALIILAQGFEEIEAVIPIDILRRSGIDVIIAGLDSIEVIGSRNIILKAEYLLKDIHDEFDVIIFPGGSQGANNLANSKIVASLIKSQFQSGRIIAAICASPAVVLAPTGILSGKKITCFPDFKNDLPDNVIYSDDKVVVDNNIITSRGPGTAFQFSITLSKILVGEKIADVVTNAALYKE